MRENVLLTGSPGVGKTTVVEKVVERARDRGKMVRGVFSPEIRDDGERVGFRITDVSTKNSEVMAHVGYDGPAVGKYGVDVSAVESVAREAVVAYDADTVVVDEVAPMQTHSEVFVERVRAVLDSPTPVVAVVQEARETGFVGSVKDRDDVMLVRVTEANRDGLPDDILCRLGL
ncbi:MAG: NTPase [Halobacteriales archaeon]|nr:NTPase [Halobacteriales archaeon]